MSKKNRTLSYYEMFAYCCGFIFLNIGQLADQYSLYFLTDIAKISATAVGPILMGTTLIAAFCDPIIGNFVDQTNTRFGKYRPFVMFCPIGAAIFMIMRFYVPDMNSNALIAYYAITGMAFTLIHNCAAVPMAAYKSVLTPDYDERNVLFSLSSISSTLITALLGMVVLDSVAKLGGGQSGWFKFVCIAWAVGLLAAFICQNGVKKKDAPGMIATPPKKPLVTSIFRMFKNKPVMCVALAMFCATFVTMITNNVQIHYYEHVLHDTSVLKTTSAYGLPIQLAALMLMPLLLKKISKRGLLIIGFALSISRPFVIMLFGADLSVNTVIVLILVSRVGAAFFTPAISSWLPECVDWTNLKEGAGAAALIGATISFLQKTGRAVAQGAVGGILAFAGYVPGSAITPEATQAILNLNGLYGVVGLCIAMIPILMFPISRDKATEIREELSARREMEHGAEKEA